ncbi:hypothetical protein Trydic_g3274 [Trypoxylus dichotomus]
MNISQPTIPQKRGKAAEVVLLVIAILLFVIGICFSNIETKFEASGIAFATCLFTIMLTEIIMRICLVCEEVYHMRSRYDNVKDLVDRILYQLEGGVVFCFMASLLFHSLLKPKFGPIYQAITIGSLNGLDYGSAMAYSFYHGYLQIVLPHKGTEKKGIKELIADFEANEGVTFGYRKLLVLIPLSLHCPPTVETKSTIVESSKSLGEIIVDRAGVNKRVYKNTAYKIKDEADSKNKIYVCLEYATPLQTLFEIINHRNEHANDYALQRKELVLQFYLTLQNLLNNDPDCKDCCDLIFFDDKTENDEYVDVGKVVLAHINKYRNKRNRSKSVTLQLIE